MDWYLRVWAVVSAEAALGSVVVMAGRYPKVVAEEEPEPEESIC